MRSSEAAKLRVGSGQIRRAVATRASISVQAVSRVIIWQEEKKSIKITKTDAICWILPDQEILNPQNFPWPKNFYEKFWKKIFFHLLPPRPCSHRSLNPNWAQLAERFVACLSKEKKIFFSYTKFFENPNFSCSEPIQRNDKAFRLWWPLHLTRGRKMLEPTPAARVSAARVGVRLFWWRHYANKEFYF